MRKILEHYSLGSTVLGLVKDKRQQKLCMSEQNVSKPIHTISLYRVHLASTNVFLQLILLNQRKVRYQWL